MLSDSNNTSTATNPIKDNTQSLVNNTSTKCITLDGIKYRSILCLIVVYCHSHAIINKGSLVDRGSNGELCGTDIRIIEETGWSVDIQDIENYQITDVHIVTVGAIVHTKKGHIIIILHQYVYIGHG